MLHAASRYCCRQPGDEARSAATRRFEALWPAAFYSGSGVLREARLTDKSASESSSMLLTPAVLSVDLASLPDPDHAGHRPGWGCLS